MSRTLPRAVRGSDPRWVSNMIAGIGSTVPPFEVGDHVGIVSNSLGQREKLVDSSRGLRRPARAAAEDCLRRRKGYGNGCARVALAVVERNDPNFVPEKRC